MTISRRRFLGSATAISLGFTGLGCVRPNTTAPSIPTQTGFGPLLDDPDGIIALPEGFSYRIVSERFRNGKVTTRELLEAQTTLSTSRFALNQARFAHLTLLASLEAQIGVAQADWISYMEEGK